MSDTQQTASETPCLHSLIHNDREAEIVAHFERQLADSRANEAAALGLVSRIREALGDNGKRMQPELIAYCRELAEVKDRAERGYYGRGFQEMEKLYADRDALQRRVQELEAVAAHTHDQADDEIGRLLGQLAAARADSDRMREALLLSEVWSVPEIVIELCKAASILLYAKNYDGHGYERIQFANASARTWLGSDALRAAIDPAARKAKT